MGAEGATKRPSNRRPQDAGGAADIRMAWNTLSEMN
jgi:hypothetical protein